MKKILVFTFIFAILFCLNIFNYSSFAELKIISDCDYVLYTNDNNFKDSEFNVVENGNSFIVVAPKNKATQLLGQAKSVSGEALVFNNFYNKNAVLNDLKNNLNYKVISIEQVNEIVVLNCYSSKLHHSVVKNNSKINVQIAIGASCITVGYPLILHSF